MKNWKNIWESEERANNAILQALIIANGYDSGAGSLSVSAFKQFAERNISKLLLDKNDSIFEIGCGSGAFLYDLYLDGYKVSGIDFSLPLITLANKIIGKQFYCSEANQVNVSEKYDIVLSNGVFHYFPSLDYAKGVVEKMITKASKKVAIFDINDKSKEREYHQIRSAAMDEAEYKEKYKGLEHLFYDKRWFEDIAKKHNLEIEIWDQDNVDYENSKLRFNILMVKK